MRLPHLFLGLLAISLALGACDSPSEESPPPATEPELDCLQEGYPCSMADVPPDVRDATVEALNDAYEAAYAGSLSDARAVLEVRTDLAEIDSDETALRFRLEGGAPAFLYDVTALGEPESAERLRASDSDPSYVVGEDTDDDGKVNNRDEKRALVLDPYDWQVSHLGSSRMVADRLAATADYEGNVRYLSNPDAPNQFVSLADWQSWDRYDAVFVATHGKRTTWGGKTAVIIYTGVRTDLMQSIDVTGAVIGRTIDRKLDQSNAIVEYVVGEDFFREAYPSGLDDAFVCFTSCETGGGGASDLAKAMSGGNFVMLGWSETVRVRAAFSALDALSRELSQGLRVEEALDRLREDGLDRDLNPFGNLAVLTRFAPGGGDQRLIEVPTLLFETGDPLIDGADLSNVLDGIAGDGIEDELEITTRLAGIEEGTEGDYRVRYEFDGTPVGDSEGYGLTLATRLDRSTVEVVHDVALGIDAPTELVELEAIVDLPEGGESRYAARVDFGNDCGWTMNFAGSDHGGAYEGGFGAVLRGPPTTLLLSDAPQGSAFPSITVFFPERLPTSVPATLALGLSGSANPATQDGVLEIGFEDDTYQSGDGSPCCTETNPVDNFPPPLTMTLEQNDADRVTGRITGRVWAFAPDGGTPLRKAEVDIEFTISGTGDCQISDPMNP